MKRYPIFTSLLLVIFFYYSIIAASPNIDSVVFNKITSPVQSNINAVTWVNNELCIAVTSDGKVLRSEDAGLNWTTVESGVTKSLNDISFYDETFGIAVGGDENVFDVNTVFLSTQDLGLTWFRHQTEFELDPLYCCDISNRQTTAGLEKNSMLTGESNAFAFGNQGVAYKQTSALCLAGYLLYYFPLEDFSPFNYAIFSVFFYLLLGCIVGAAGLLGVSNDGGESWTSKDSGTNENLNTVAHNSSEQKMAAGGDNGTFIGSTNDGDTWSSYNSGTTENINGMATFESSDETLFCYVTDKGHIFIKEGLESDPLEAQLVTGNNLAKTNLDDPDFNDIAISTEGVIIVVGNEGTIYRGLLAAPPIGPSNPGISALSQTEVKLTWNDNSDNETGFNIYRKGPSDPDYSLIGTVDQNVTEYIDLNFITGETYYYRVFAFNDIGESSIYTETNITVTDTEDENLTPTNFALNQNYPNPFNPTTLISYQLGADSYVSLIIYDLLGNEISTLVNGYKSAGTYEVEFNACNLTSGVYIYKMQAGAFKQNRKMLLMK